MRPRAEPGRRARPVVAALLALAALATGCATQQGYAGPERSSAEVAVVRADPALSAGLPVQVRLRKVDEREVSASHSAVEVLPGAHRFLVDCSVAGEGTTRFLVEGEVAAGREYRLEATASARSCDAVSLIIRDP